MAIDPEKSAIRAEEILADRDAFNAFAYIHWQDALKELENRRGNESLSKYLEKILPSGVPSAMQGKKNMALFRHIATPNYEIRRFAIVADSLPDLQPLILEYNQDQFNNRNDCKFALAKLPFRKGLSKDGSPIVEKKTILDINAANNQPISSLQTKWGESLVEFHHNLFREALPHLDTDLCVSDISDWLHEHGPAAKDYYKAFLSLFLRDGILFENFVIYSKEYGFIKDIILPALFEIEEETGMRPLIVALEPTEIEGDDFWVSHPYDTLSTVSEKLTGK